MIGRGARRGARNLDILFRFRHSVVGLRASFDPLVSGGKRQTQNVLSMVWWYGGTATERKKKIMAGSGDDFFTLDS